MEDTAKIAIFKGRKIMNLGTVLEKVANTLQIRSSFMHYRSRPSYLLL